MARESQKPAHTLIALIVGGVSTVLSLVENVWEGATGEYGPYLTFLLVGLWVVYFMFLYQKNKEPTLADDLEDTPPRKKFQIPLWVPVAGTILLWGTVLGLYTYTPYKVSINGYVYYEIQRDGHIQQLNARYAKVEIRYKNEMLEVVEADEWGYYRHSFEIEEAKGFASVKAVKPGYYGQAEDIDFRRGNTSFQKNLLLKIRLPEQP
ncbi:MAG: hypothetical protein AAFR61_09915 [Bacteroidota bacterium]